MTEAEYLTWAKNPDNAANRVVLLTISKPGMAVLLSNVEYSDSTAHFDDFITDLPGIETSLDGVSFGRVSAADLAGEWDSYKFRGANWSLMWGDVSWSIADFRTIGAGLVTGATQSGQVWTFELSGHDTILNNQMVADGDVLGIGIAQNINSVLQDAANLVYRYSTNNADSFAVYDRGVSLSAGVTDNNNGTFTLTNAPDGLITVNIVHAATYTVKLAIDYIASLAGYSVPEYVGLTTAQLGYYVGAAYYEGATYYEAITEIARSVGAYVYLDGAQIKIIRLAQINPVGTITDDEIINGSVSQSGLLNALDVVKINYLKNNSVMSLSDLAGAALPSAERFVGDYVQISANTNQQTNGSFYEDETVDTVLYYAGHANTELTLFKNNRQNDRRIYRFKAPVSCALYRPGDYVNIDSSVIPFASGNVYRHKMFADGLFCEIDILEGP